MFHRFLAGSFALAAFAQAATINVPGDQPTIQAGLDAAAEGDTVLVAPGTYIGSGNRGIDFGGIDRVLLAEMGADSTVIDCQQNGRGFSFHSGETMASVVDGFTITGGYSGNDKGGGVSCVGASPSFQSCTITGNRSNDEAGGIYLRSSTAAFSECEILSNRGTGDAGGVLCDSSAPKFDSCLFEHNEASGGGDGGGAFCTNSSSPEFTDCRFYANTSSSGGGIYCRLDSSPTVTRCAFDSNSAYSVGGGLYCGNGSAPRVQECTLSGNSAGDGGALYCTGGNPEVLQTRIEANWALIGGGVYCEGGAEPVFKNVEFIANRSEQGDGGGGGAVLCGGASPRFDGCLFVGNTAKANGGAIYSATSWPEARNCTFFGNIAGLDDGDGGALYTASSFPLLINCVLWNDLPQEIYQYGGSRTVEYSDVQGGHSGQGNIDADPLFIDSENGDFQLDDGSPCIDAGDPFILDACRPAGRGGERSDMGAFGGSENCGWGQPCDAPSIVRSLEPDSIYVTDTAEATWSLESCPEEGFDFTVNEPCQWLQVEPANGTIPPDSSIILTLMYSAESLLPGTYTCPVTIAYGDSGVIEEMFELTVVSPLIVAITDAPDHVRQGARLRWDFQITNISDQGRSVDAWFDAYVLGGMPYAGNPILGPFTGWLAAGNSGDFHATTKVPSKAPVGSPYKICTVLGTNPDEWVSDCFEFAIQP